MTPAWKWWKEYPRPEWATRGFLGLTGWSPFKDKPFVWIHAWTGRLRWDVDTASRYGLFTIQPMPVKNLPTKESLRNLQRETERFINLLTNDGPEEEKKRAIETLQDMIYEGGGPYPWDDK